MSLQEDFLKTIGTDESLMDEVMQAWEQRVSAKEIADLLASKGVEASIDQVEALLAKAQEDVVDTIEAQNLDLDELDRVAGGGNGKCDGVADCDDHFKVYSDTKRDDRCNVFKYCDEVLARQCRAKAAANTCIGDFD